MAPMKCPSHRPPVDAIEDSVTLTHLAHRWHTTRRQIRKMLQQGILPFVEVRGQLRVPSPAIQKYEATKG